jgi:protocatechuate 4,5-dioxygenase beta chain
MAKILGQISTSHIPAIGNAIARGLQNEPYWKPFFDGFHKVHEWLNFNTPDTVIVVSNDHGLNFFLDKMPTFAVGAAYEYGSADEGWGLHPIPPVTGNIDLSWHIIEHLVADEFDITTCQEMLIDHAITNPIQLLWNEQPPPVKIVPISINTVQHPIPSAKRCLALGQSIGRAIQSYAKDEKILVLATGGLSHQLEGERAGFINPEFDKECLNALIETPEVLTKYSSADLVELSGSQGVEILNWIVGRGIISGKTREIHRNYHIPISNTAAATQILEPVS